MFPMAWASIMVLPKGSGSNEAEITISARLYAAAMSEQSPTNLTFEQRLCALIRYSILLLNFSFPSKGPTMTQKNN